MHPLGIGVGRHERRERLLKRFQLPRQRIERIVLDLGRVLVIIPFTVIIDLCAQLPHARSSSFKIHDILRSCLLYTSDAADEL